jgi:vancomycin permeability regulator SanA
LNKVEIEVYSETVNAIVARYPGRKFPALLLQGDDLNNMYKFVREIRLNEKDIPIMVP